MPTSMRNICFKITVLGFFLFSSTKSFTQTAQTFVQLNNLISDVLVISDSYITPANDAAVYQSSSSWVTTPKKSKLWDVTLSLHANAFFVPKRDTKMEIKNSDFSFFSIENATSATIPTALGNDNQVWLVGQINNGSTISQVRLKTPEGINQQSIVYPYLQGTLGLWKGTDVVAKYSTKVNLKKGYYQVYGFGLKHNLSQYFKNVETKNIYFSGLIGFSKEDISFNFLDTQTNYGNIGLNEVKGLVDTWQFQFNLSKQLKKFELMSALIVNNSNFKYEVNGEKGQIEQFIPFQSLVNSRLSQIYKTKTNLIGELSGRYQFHKLYIQTGVAFGKFVNTNLSVQYGF